MPFKIALCRLPLEMHSHQSEMPAVRLVQIDVFKRHAAIHKGDCHIVIAATVQHIGAKAVRIIAGGLIVAADDMTAPAMVWKYRASGNGAATSWIGL